MKATNALKQANTIRVFYYSNKNGLTVNLTVFNHEKASKIGPDRGLSEFLL